MALLDQFMIYEFILYCSLSMVETHFSDCITLSKRDRDNPFLEASSDFTVASNYLWSPAMTTFLAYLRGIQHAGSID